MIKKGTKNKSFRKYNVNDHVSAINGGRKHFVNQSIEYVKEIWKDLGFKEMTGYMVETSFWDFDALFQPQDHPARDMQDTFYLKNKKENILQKKELIEAVKKSHEEGVAGSKGWKYKWSEEESKKLLLRTHTTNLSARTLAS